MLTSAGRDETTTPNTIHEIDALTHREDLVPHRLRSAKKAYTTRHLATRLDIDPSGYKLLSGPSVVPQPGDVVLALIDEIGMHTKLESPAGRRQTLFAGDEVLLAYGHRYAPDQFEAEVPSDLRPVHLIAAGGLSGLVVTKHENIKDPTVVHPMGLLADTHGVVTLRRLAPRHPRPRSPEKVTGSVPQGRPKVIGVLGTSMNAGKSATVNSLVRGLGQSGLRVSAGKATGTGAGGDPHGFTDAGAAKVLDFTDFGFPSTFRLGSDEVRSILVSLIEELSTPEPDVIVIEIADGLYQTETDRLLADPVFSQSVDQIVFAASGALGATAGVALLRNHGLPVSAVSGTLTSAPLATREAQEVLDVPVINTFELADPETLRAVL
ncbi:hypothetical protein [Haloactinomyces albus]|uniref:DUF1611 domain-containing protein n=1 Tax=Haloactinomyces albus TaxID=1352928 RepID=A0AAE3ZFH4_9ACTN|nr:hypothetical protein [Haloactinomyces albus]MDR7303993.1 hypothetical protein [Haloactinomyces albus]